MSTEREELYYKMGFLRGEIHIIQESRKSLSPNSLPDKMAVQIIGNKEEEITEIRKKLGLIT